jgi:hypothetical protein
VVGKSHRLPVVAQDPDEDPHLGQCRGAGGSDRVERLLCRLGI